LRRPDEKQLANALFLRQLPPPLHKPRGFGQLLRLVNQNELFACDGQVARVRQSGRNRKKMGCIVLGAAVGLLDEDAIARAVPNPGPGFICPAQTKRKVGRSRGKDLLQRTFEQAPPLPEPVVPVTKRLDTVSAR